jgi:hypothetical protein
MQLLAGRAEEALACRNGKGGLPAFRVHRYCDRSEGPAPGSKGCLWLPDRFGLTLSAITLLQAGRRKG